MILLLHFYDVGVKNPTIDLEKFIYFVANTNLNVCLLYTLSSECHL